MLFWNSSCRWVTSSFSRQMSSFSSRLVHHNFISRWQNKLSLHRYGKATGMLWNHFACSANYPFGRSKLMEWLFYSYNYSIPLRPSAVPKQTPTYSIISDRRIAQDEKQAINSGSGPRKNLGLSWQLNFYGIRNDKYFMWTTSSRVTRLIRRQGQAARWRPTGRALLALTWFVSAITACAGRFDVHLR